MSSGINEFTAIIIISAFCMGIVANVASVAATEDSVTLKCDELERSYESANGELYCAVSGFVVSHSQNVYVQRYPKSNMTRFMKFYESRLLYVPYKLFDVYANLKTLDASYTEIIEITRNTFGNAGNLTYLNLSNNNITNIPASVFLGATNLMRLDLSSNRIVNIDELAFHGLPFIDKIQLSNNQLIEINRNAFTENPYIEVIALDSNLIERIEPEVFNHLRRVREVNLSSNRLRHLDPNTFYNAWGLEVLTLSRNYLQEFSLANKSIKTALFVDHNNLTSLAINGTQHVTAKRNQINRIDMINAVFLESLVLSENNISDIENITIVTGLSELDLSHNPIGELKINTFDPLKRLRSLSLRAIGLRHLFFGMFSKQLMLETLDLAFNNLTELNLDIFYPYLSHLQHFYIDGNNLSEIHGKFSFNSAFENLLTLGVSRNRFNCSYLHWLLTPPNLSTAVTLHIEPDDSDVETSHIRDVSCVSETQKTLHQTQNDLRAMTELQRSLQEAMGRLEIYLMVLKITLLSIVCLLLALFTLRFWRTKRVSYIARRSSSIVFRSNVAVNNNLEP